MFLIAYTENDLGKINWKVVIEKGDWEKETNRDCGKVSTV